MKIETFSIVVGGNSCNAICPFCISRMTGPMEPVAVPNWRNFHIACNLAEKSGVTTALLTGKGEPTLYPKLISDYLKALSKYNIPLKELQTNGIALNKDILKEWYDNGLTTVAISCVHYRWERNCEIYGDNYRNLADIVPLIHSAGLSVRLCCMMVRGYIDNVDRVRDFIVQAKINEIEQLTVRPIRTADNLSDNEVGEWTGYHEVPPDNIKAIGDWLDRNGKLLMVLPHGAKVYDVSRQNICIANCLTIEPHGTIRQLIYYPDGHIKYDWQYEGAVLL